MSVHSLVWRFGYGSIFAMSRCGLGALSNSLEIQTSHTSHTQAAREIGNIIALSLTLASIQRRVYGETPDTT